MNSGNIGDVSNIFGKSVNIIVSNASLKDLLSSEANLSLPDSSIIIVNPINENGNKIIDKGWHDICFTDNNQGISSLLPFTSVDTTNGIYDVIENVDGNRQLICNLPFNNVDGVQFSIDDKVLKINGVEQIIADITKHKNELSEAYKDDIKKLKELNDQTFLTVQKIKEIEDSFGDDSKFEELKNGIKNASEAVDLLNQINEAQESFKKQAEQIKQYIETETKKYDDFESSEFGKKLSEKIEDLQKEQQKLNTTIDTYKQDLYRRYCALKEDLQNIVNEQMIPVIQAQLLNCMTTAINCPDGAIQPIKEFSGAFKAAIQQAVGEAMKGSSISGPIFNKLANVLQNGTNNAEPEENKFVSELQNIAKDAASQQVANSVDQFTGSVNGIEGKVDDMKKDLDKTLETMTNTVEEFHRHKHTGKVTVPEGGGSGIDLNMDDTITLGSLGDNYVEGDKCKIQ